MRILFTESPKEFCTRTLQGIGEVTGVVSKWRRGYFAHVFIPLISLALLAGLTYGYRTQSIPFQKETTAVTFIVICIFGAFAGIYPRRMSRIPTFREKSIENFPGHHPNCGHFKTHVLTVKSHRLCAGCTGLVVGAILGVGFTLVMFPVKDKMLAELFFWTGFTLTTGGILQHTLDFRNPIIHTGLNVVLVLGVSMSRLSADILNGGILVAIYSIAFTLYLIIARIELSQNDHRMICEDCGENCGHSFAS